MARLAASPLVMEGSAWADYGLIDSGDGRKLERYGPYRFIRPEPQAMWAPRLSEAEWQAHGEFIPGSDEDGGGRWHFTGDVPESGWEMAWNEARFTAQCTPFRHLGFFPDMAPVWDWMRERLSDPPQNGEGDHAQHGGGASSDSAPPPPSAVPLPQGGGYETLNLFGYTGVGSLALSRHGRVTHVDASKKSVAQARDNAALSGMEERPIRWLIDDAAKFTAREVRRENRYDGIILDPPKFGRGPKNETWRLEESLPGLIGDCRQLLDGDSRFLFLTVYAVRMSALAIGGLVVDAFADLPGTVECGELAVREEGEGGRLLPTAIFARWRSD